MATDRARRVVCVVAALPALLLMAAPTTARAATAWWQPLAYAGVRVSAVSVTRGHLIVDTPNGRFASTDRGATFTATTTAPAPSLPVDAGTSFWDIRNGTVMTGTPAVGTGIVTEHPDPAAPYLGAAAHLLAAPAAAPGVVIAVGTDNHVWRRTAFGSWSTAFIPLPAGGLSGAPQVTSVAAFTEPLSVAVYLGVDGYGVLLSNDGGDDWIRADPGLPENVLGLATDPAAKALYAATDQGLYVHQLQSFPAPPVYADSALYLRWLGIAAVALLATALALLTLRRLLPRPAT
ncbi:MAG TPA: hypothetical protein VIG86_04575 [Candidatus Dormibacteraeota bacterium]|jgi:hypothetical protein